MMDQVISQLHVGGYALPDTEVPDDLPVDIVDARAFVHAGLPNRQIIRLTSQNIAAGVDASMDTLGFSLVTVQRDVALQKRQELGFPEWVLVHSPKDAGQALGVATQFRKEARKASAKPGSAKSAFDAILAELESSTPHFLPTLCEQMGRVFIESGNQAYAATYFGKAREAEQKFGLEVEEKRRTEVFLEFSLAGAVTAKTMVAYAKDLAKRYNKATAYEFWTNSCVRLTLGGNSPTVAMFSELKRIAKAAGIVPEVAEDLVLSQIWHSPAIARAPAEVWEVLADAFVRLRKAEPAMPVYLLHAFPKSLSSGSGFSTFWFGFLKKTGALEVLESQTQQGAIAQWLSKFIERTRTPFFYVPHRFPTAACVFIECHAARLRQEATPIVIGGDGWKEDAILDLLDLLLELNVPVDAGGAEFGLRRWGSVEEKEIKNLRGLEFVAAHPEYGPRLDAAVKRVVDDKDFQKAAEGKPALRRGSQNALLGSLEILKTGSIASFGEAVAKLIETTTSATFVECPEVWDALQNIDVVEPLLSTLRRGFLAEFDWPAARAAATELGEGVAISGVFPFLALHNNRRAIVVRGAERVLEHDFKLKKGDMVSDLRFAGGQLLVNLNDSDDDFKMYWSGNPNHRFDGAFFDEASAMSFHRADGSVVEGLMAYRAGDEHFPEQQQFITDGHSFWSIQSWLDPKFFEFDPTNAAFGAESIPKLIEDCSEDDWEMDVRFTQVYPVPDGSPMGSVDGLFFTAVFENDVDTHIQTPLGRAKGEGYVCLIQMPSGETFAINNDSEIHDLDGCLMDFLPETSASFFGLSYLHYADALDEPGSKRLREASKAAVSDLLTSVIHETKFSKPPPLSWLQSPDKLGSDKALLQILGESALTAPVRELVTRHVHNLQTLSDFLDATNPRVSAARANVVLDSTVWSAFEFLASGRDREFANDAWEDDRDLNQGVSSLMGFFEHGKVPSVFPNYFTSFGWIFRFTPMLGWVAALPSIEEQRDTLLNFIQTLAESGLLGLVGHFSMFETTQECWQDHGVDLASRSFFVEHKSTRFFGVSKEYDRKSYSIIAYSLGDLDLPTGVTFAERFPGLPWDTGKALQLVKIVLEKGPYSVSYDAMERLAAATGLVAAEAAMVLSGLHNADSWGAQIMDADLRKVLKLKATDLKLARENLRGISSTDRSAIFAAAMPPEPLDLWERPLEVADGLANAWNGRFGRHQELPEEILAALNKDAALSDAKKALLSVYAEPNFPVGGVIKHCPYELEISIELVDGAIGVDEIVDCLRMIPYLYYTLPAGHEVFDKLPIYFEALRNAVFADGVLMPVMTDHEWIGNKKKASALLARLGADQTLEGIPYYDDGSSVFVLGSSGLHAAIRPKQLLLEGANIHIGADNSAVFALNQFVLLEKLIQRMRSSPPDAGDYEADPKKSAPSVVADVMVTMDVSEPAAIAFLQTLAMPNPSTKNLRLWNDWTSGTYKNAMMKLVGKGVLLEAKRARSGRAHFLDGPWVEFAAPCAPMEEWKVSMMPLLASDEGAFGYPNQPAQELFEMAWARWRSGDKPGFTK